MSLRSVLSTSMQVAKRRRLLVNLSVAAIIVVALTASLGSLALAASSSFPDVPGSHPNYAAITDLADRGIISGKTDGKFYPSDPVTRQQFAKMIVGTGGYPVSEANVCPFGDVTVSGPGDLYPDNFVAVCAAQGITLGKTETTFDPTGNITRYQVISMVVRTANDLQPGLLAAPPAGFGAWSGDPTHGANAARAEYNDLLAGLDLASLNPLGNMTRGEVAQVLHNLLLKLGGSPGTTGSSVPAATYTLSVSTAGTGSGTVAKIPDQTTFAAGSTVVLTATAATGSIFMSWSGDASGDTNPLTVTMDSNKTIVATFNAGTVLYSLNTSVPGGGGTITKSPDQAMYPSGTSVQLTAVPATGYTFHHWTGAVTGITNPASVVMDSHKTVQAVFVPDVDYEDVGVTLNAGPAVASPLENNLTVFMRASSGSLLQLMYNGTWAAAPQNLGGGIKSGSSPAAAYRSFLLVDVFVRGTNDHLYWLAGRGQAGFADWQDMGGSLMGSDPAVCAPEIDELAVFWRHGSTGQLVVRRYKGTTWEGIGSVNGSSPVKPMAGSSPAAVSPPDFGGHIDVFIRGTNSHLYQTHYNPTTHNWSAFNDTGIVIGSSPAVASWAKGHIDVIFRGTSNHLYHTSTENGGTTWRTPIEINDTAVVGDPDAVSWGPNRIDVVVRGTNNHLLHTWFDGTKWHP